MSEPSMPVERNLSRLVDALKVTEAELSFQVHRLTDMVTPRTSEERAHLQSLKAGYSEARQNVRRLRKYHEARLSRLEVC